MPYIADNCFKLMTLITIYFRVFFFLRIYILVSLSLGTVLKHAHAQTRVVLCLILYYCKRPPGFACPGIVAEFHFHFLS